MAKSILFISKQFQSSHGRIIIEKAPFVMMISVVYYFRSGWPTSFVTGLYTRLYVKLLYFVETGAQILRLYNSKLYGNCLKFVL